MAKTASTFVRRWIESLGPYQSLAILAAPACVVELLKLVALAVAGDGHWYTGVAMVIAAYAVSLFVVERLFVTVKPKLLQIRRFARLWAFVIGWRNRFIKAVVWSVSRRSLQRNHRMQSSNDAPAGKPPNAARHFN